MGPLVTYLNFDGTCRDAMTFYQSCFAADLQLTTFADMPGSPVPDAIKHRIMHARLSKGPVTLMASDTFPGSPLTPGTNFSISVHPESAAELDAIWTALSHNATITQPLMDAPWGARFGMLTDQFGIQWMFNYEHPRQ